jgi:large subunit ribosomal protein L9
MKLILSKDVPNLGRKGQVVEVSDGHARNFLIPRHLALPATSAKLFQVQKEETEHETRIQKELAYARELKKKLESKTFQVKGKADGARLFASIRTEEIAQVINEILHLSILPSSVIITQTIKTLGAHECEIKLSSGTNAKVKIEVEKI